MTQQDIARMTGVSQATVSVVLNGRSDHDVKIAADTRDRVLRAIAETGYVADPVARRLAARHNRILGVFTYEPVFPSGNSDFYHPFLVGIEQRAEELGCDLLLLTSAPVVDGRRRIFSQDNRLRLADGCIVLGRSLDREDVTRLVADGTPFVSIGRRDDAGGPVPYVGADYAAAVADLVRRAITLGHRRLAYVGYGAGPESWVDRMRGFREAVAATRARAMHALPAGAAATADPSTGRSRRPPVTSASVADLLDALVQARITVALHEAARVRGVELAIASLGAPARDGKQTDISLTRLRMPRREMGVQAVDVLTALIEQTSTEIQRLLPCDIVEGATLTAPRSSVTPARKASR